MANEFVIKRGLVVSGSSELSGSLTVSDLAAAAGQVLEIGTGGVLQTSGNTLNQNLGTSATPSFAGLTVNGNTIVTGNLDVQGTTTFINTTDIFIKDKLVVIASGSTTTADADGGGLFISGANASITWDNGNSRMAFNKPLFVNGALTATSLAGTGGSITGLNASNLSSGTVPTGRLTGTYSISISGTAATATTATQVGNSLTPGSYLTGTAYNGSVARTFAVDATTTNTASKIVARDASGNFAAGTITAALSGNASTATTLQTARTINGTSFNGSANITITANTTNALTIGTGLSGTSFNGSSAVTIAIDSSVVTLTGTQTLTNKTLTSPVITSPSFGSSNIVSTGASSSLSGSFTGSFFGDGSGLSGVSATFPITSTTITPTLKYFVNDGAASRYVDQTLIGAYMAGTGLTNTNGILSLTNSTISGISLGSNLNTLTRGTYLTGNNYNGSAATTWAVDATSANTVSKVVARDASGNFSAGTITATLSGNASTATTLQTARTINGTSFNGSANITITANTPNALTAGSGLSAPGTFTGATARTFTVDSGSMLSYYSSSILDRVSGDITVNGSTGVAAIGSGVIVNADINASAAIAVSKLAASTITIGSTSISLGSSATTIAGLTSVTSTTFVGALSGNASTATTLQTARTINGVSFNGSANITITANTTNALTIGTGLSGTSFNGSGAVTIAIDSTVATLTGTQTLTNKTLTSPTINNGLIATPTLVNTVTLNTAGISGDSRILRGAATTTVGTVTVLTSGTTSGEAVFFDYVIAKSTTDMRAGTVMAVANGSTLRFAEQATTDIGNTSTVILQCSQAGGNITLQAVDSIGGFTVRALARTI